MSHAIFADGFRADARRIPADLRIPAPPRGRRRAAASTEAWWREAMRWAMIGLTASWTAGELTLMLLGL
jgi:hypothetical protein